jgi:hypothetical protein
MANNNNQDIAWDPTSFYLSQVASVACEDSYLAGPLDSAFCVSIDLQAGKIIAEKVQLQGLTFSRFKTH